MENQNLNLAGADNNEISLLPKKGYRKEIAKMVGCSEKTVTLALRRGIKGYKCDKVREIYRRLYMK
ncbi:MAG: hypothetical protein IJS05_07835 [Paludibacteraceae bacterium]|nr:hypothetical protein [Paludibacteraceae bacterium]